ncbi:hypothetical protein GX411_04090 [Candidatus Fermentibacteria bacterium]|nr:hypothetical protein [Candidatus Fermentibacteria bacterium]
MEPSVLLDRLDGLVRDGTAYAVMIIDRDHRIVWHNHRFSMDVGRPGEDLCGMSCWESLGDSAMHPGCPAAAAREGGSPTAGIFDFGRRLFVFTCIPMGEGFIAKLHQFLGTDAMGGWQVVSPVEKQTADRGIATKPAF